MEELVADIRRWTERHTETLELRTTRTSETRETLRSNRVERKSRKSLLKKSFKKQRDRPGRDYVATATRKGISSENVRGFGQKLSKIGKPSTPKIKRTSDQEFLWNLIDKTTHSVPTSSTSSITSNPLCRPPLPPPLPPEDYRPPEPSKRPVEPPQHRPLIGPEVAEPGEHHAPPRPLHTPQHPEPVHVQWQTQVVSWDMVKERFGLDDSRVKTLLTLSGRSYHTVIPGLRSLQNL